MAKITIPYSNKPRNDISAEYAHESVAYNPLTGIFVWRKRPATHFPDERAMKIWNTKYARTIAGHCNKRGYLYLTISKKNYGANRLAHLMMTGAWPKNQIDHKDLNKSNNKWKNLREATHGQNQQNKAMPKNNTSGYKGVRWHTIGKKWMAEITIGGKRLYLGLFLSKEDAYNAYCEAAKEYHKSFAQIQ